MNILQKVFGRKESKDLTKIPKIEQKSSQNGSDYFTFGTGCSYITPNTGISPYNLLAQNKSFVYACSKKIEQYISSIPIHTYSYTANQKSLVVANKPVTKSVLKAMKTNPRIMKKAMDVVEITESEHPLNKLIMAPAIGYSYADWVSLITGYLLIMGNCLLEVIKDGEEIVELKPLKWEYVYPIYTNGKITQYNYQAPNETYRTLSPEQVVHIKNIDVGNTEIGKGNLEACIDSATLYNYYDQYQIALASNYAMPGVAINVNNKVSNVEEAKKISEEFIRKFGKNNNGKPMVTFGDVDVTTLSVSPKDMEYKTGREWALKTIAACFGVPEDLVSTTDSNRASSLTAIAQFVQITCYPLLNKILEQINTQVVAKYYDENAYYFYDPNEILDKDQTQQAAVLNSYVASGVMTVNEARAILGLEEIEIVKETI